MKQPRKIYTIDNGLSASISPKFTDDRGSALENLVFQELYRRSANISYFSATDCEIDFVVHQNRKVETLIQVAFSIEDLETRKREINGLIKGGERLRAKNLLLITWEKEDRIETKEHAIKVVPIWKWLLEK